ncbi:minor tail protein [Microbacterium phage Percival]|uniref:Minor tail protein n=1 Tax=Microbacterium phage Percival TaxID=2201439 RepID=A0A2Z4Q6J0_9CAUD|nr:minor tail protein [Microbacterium phage Percival]
MAMTSWPRVNEDTTDAQYGELFNSIIGSGVRDTAGLKVTADSSGLSVKVAAGFAVVAGNAFLSTAVETLTIAANSGSTTRTDMVYLRRDFTAPAGQTVRLMVKTGSTAASSDPRGGFDLPLAYVTVPAGAATITSGNVTDRRSFLAASVGIWETASRPAGAVPGRMGFNLTLGAFEGLGTSGWGPLVTWATLSGKPALIPVAEGGTGAKDAATARANLGAAAASHAHAWTEVTGKPTTFPPSTHGHALTDSNITGTLPINQGGTGATNAAEALQALGIFVQATAPAHANGRVWIKRP